MRTLSLALMASLLILGCFGCASDNPVAPAQVDGSSQVGNAIPNDAVASGPLVNGWVRHPNGTPAVGITVRVEVSFNGSGSFIELARPITNGYGHFEYQAFNAVGGNVYRCSVIPGTSMTKTWNGSSAYLTFDWLTKLPGYKTPYDPHNP